MNFFGQLYLQILKLHFYVVNEDDILKLGYAACLTPMCCGLASPKMLTNHMKAFVKKRHMLVQNRTASVLEQFQLTENAADNVKCRNAQCKYFPLHPHGECYFLNNCELSKAHGSTRVHQPLFAFRFLSGGPQWCKKEQKMTDRLA
jgi:hypothetical protein